MDFGLFEYLTLLIQYVDDCINQIDPVMEAFDVAKTKMNAAIKDKEEAFKLYLKSYLPVCDGNILNNKNSYKNLDTK